MLTLQDLLRTRTAQPPLNKAMYFNGTNAYISVPSIKLDRDLTIMFLFAPTNIAKSRQNPVHKKYWADFAITLETNGSMSAYHGDNVSGGRYFGWNPWPASTFKNNVWSFPAYVRRAGLRRVEAYVNGSLVNQTTYTIDPVASTDPITIGTGYAGYFQGYISTILIYKDYALTQSQIVHNTQNPNNPIRDGLVLWLDARACDTSKNVCWDLSGNGNHGTMYNVQIVSLPNPVRVGGSL